MSGQRRSAVTRMLQRVQREARLTPLIVVLFGGRGRRLVYRRKLATLLTESGFTALVPEVDFPPNSPSTYEVAYLRDETIDLAFIFPESPGSTTEFGQFLEDEVIAPKLIVLVPRRYHPIYGNSGGYLSDAYMKHDAKYGHVYAFDESRKTAFPKSSEIIFKICQTRRDLKYVDLEPEE